jgi:hypothetical protein
MKLRRWWSAKGQVWGHVLIMDAAGIFTSMMAGLVESATSAALLLRFKQD